MTDYTALGKSEEKRTRRLAVLKEYLKNKSPPEIAEATGYDLKQVNNDLYFLRHKPLNDLPLDLIRDMGVNFFEFQLKDIIDELASIPAIQRRNYPAYVLGLWDKMLKYKAESLKLQGAYVEPEPEAPQAIRIIIEEVGPNGPRLSPAPAEEPAPDDETEEFQDFDD